MPGTRKQKNEAGRSSEADMISDLENMVVMIGSGHYEREVSEFGNSVKRTESPSYKTLIDHNYNAHSNFIKNDIRGFA